MFYGVSSNLRLGLHTFGEPTNGALPMGVGHMLGQSGAAWVQPSSGNMGNSFSYSQLTDCSVQSAQEKDILGGHLQRASH